MTDDEVATQKEKAIARALAILQEHFDQGLPDDYTRIPWARFKRGVSAAKLWRDYAKYRRRCGTKSFLDCHPAPPDGPRYKAIGNGMAVPCVAWLLGRVHRALVGAKGLAV